jgi:tetratricopeptide (TPR) repeat protein
MFYQGLLQAHHLSLTEELAISGKSRSIFRTTIQLRGEWYLGQGRWRQASESLQEAVSLARAIGHSDVKSETLLALAQLRLGQLVNPREEAERLAKVKRPSHRALSELWLATGDLEMARKHAIEAYRWAWADGEPYVHRYELNKARALLEQLGEPIPDLPVFDPARVEKFPWEDDLAAAIEELRSEKAAEGGSKPDASQ